MPSTNAYKLAYRKSRDDGLYWRYRIIKRRCGKGSDHRRWYFDKGITVEWNSYIEFKRGMYAGYLAHIKKFGKEDTTIERLNNSKGYSKKNCTWIRLKDQHLNQSGRGRSKKAPLLDPIEK